MVVNDRLDDALEQPRRRSSQRSSPLSEPSGTRCAPGVGDAADYTASGNLEHRKGNATVISPRIDRLLEHVDSNYAERDRRRQARAPDQQLLPQPRRGNLRRVPAADGRDRLEKLPHDRPRGGSGGEDEVPLPLAPRAARGGPPPRKASASACQARPPALQPEVMARILLGVSGGIAAYKALELVRLATAAGHAVRVIQTPASRRFVGEASFAALSGAPVLTGEFERDPARGRVPRPARARRTSRSATSSWWPTPTST